MSADLSLREGRQDIEDRSGRKVDSDNIYYCYVTRTHLQIFSQLRITGSERGHPLFVLSGDKGGGFPV